MITEPMIRVMRLIYCAIVLVELLIVASFLGQFFQTAAVTRSAKSNPATGQ